MVYVQREKKKVNLPIIMDLEIELFLQKSFIPSIYGVFIWGS